MGKYGPHLDEPIQPRMREAAPVPEPAAENAPALQASAAPASTPAPVTAPELITIYVIQDKYVPPPPSPAEIWRRAQPARVVAAAGVMQYGDRAASVPTGRGRRHAADRQYQQEVQACTYGQAAALIGNQPVETLLPVVAAHPEDPAGLMLVLSRDCSLQACEAAYDDLQAEACEAAVTTGFDRFR